MSETDSPVMGSGNDSAMSVEDSAAAIANLLSNVPNDRESVRQDSVKEESENEGNQPEVDNAQAPDEELDGLEFDDETTGEGEDAPAETEFKQGKFAARDAKVKLEDGTTISVEDLIAGNMFQRTFTQKTMALAEKAKAFEAERDQFVGTIQQVEQQRNLILTLAEKLIPKEPTPVDPNEDPMGYMSYMQQREQYGKTMSELAALWQANEASQYQTKEQQTRAQVEAHQATLKAETQKLLEVYPNLKKTEEAAKFKDTLTNEGEKFFKISPEEINAITDSRFLIILDKAIRYERAIAKRDAAKRGTQQQAPTQQTRIPQRQRATQTPENIARNQAVDRLRKTGSLNDAAKALEKFV